MDLKITNTNNFIKIKGSLNRSTLHIFNEEFRHIFERTSKITVSIEEIISMDHYGISAIAALHDESIAKNKSMAIIGLGSKGLYDHFKSQIAA